MKFRKVYEFLENNILAAICFMLVIHEYNALVSMINVLAVLFLISSKTRRGLIYENIKSIDNNILMAFSVFLLSLLLASLFIGDNRSIKQSINMVYYSLPFGITYLLILVINRKDMLKKVVIGFTTAMIYSCLHIYYQYIFLDVNRPQGLYGHPNQAGSIFDIVLPFCTVYFIDCIHKKNLINFTFRDIFFCFISLVCALVALFLTGSRGAIIGIAIGLLLTGSIYCVKNLSFKKMVILGAIIAASSGLMLYGLYSLNSNKFTRSYDNERILLWKSSYNMWLDHKMIGVGLSNWKYEYQNNYILSQAKEKNLEMPHNIFAYYFSTTGLVGGIGFCIFIVLIFNYLFKNLLLLEQNGLFSFAFMWVLFAIVLHGMVECGLTMKSVYRLFCGCLGITCSFLRNFRCLK